MSTQIDTLSEKQLADRKLGIGGSDVAAILGISPWKSPLDVYLEKVGEAKPSASNERMYWGQRLEGLVADEYSRRTGNKVRRRNSTIVHSNYPWMRANIDRLVVNLDRLLECKTTGERNADQWGEPGTDQIPDLYMAQVQHYIVVTNREAVDVAVLIGGQEFRQYTVEGDREIADMLLEEENRFWHEHVLAGVPPAPRSVEEAAKLWPKHTDRSVIADTHVADAWQQLKETQEEKKRLESEEKELKLQIQQHMGDAAVLLDRDGRKQLATWKYQQQKRLDTKALKTEHPDLAEQYEAVNEFRRFLLK